MNNLAIIPARSGSKGLKDKNIKLLIGKPLIAYTIEAALKSDLFNKVIVTTDSKEYADIARQWGAEAPYLRSQELSSDTANSWDVVRDVLNYLTSEGETYDTVVLLQPTSPLRTHKDIVGAYKLYKKNSADFVVSVCEADHSPLWFNTLPPDNSVTDFINDEALKPRQSLDKYYRINGAIYIAKYQRIIEKSNLFRLNSYAYIMEKINSIDIDDQFDFDIAECIIIKQSSYVEKTQVQLK